jgi:hypothetical protein
MSPRRLLASFTFRQPCLLLLIFVVSLQVHVLFGGATIQPHTFAGVTPRGSYGYSGPFPQRHITIDPAAASEAEFGWAAYMVRAFKESVPRPWSTVPEQSANRRPLPNQLADPGAATRMVGSGLPAAVAAHSLLRAIVHAVAGH